MISAGVVYEFAAKTFGLIAASRPRLIDSFDSTAFS